MRHVGITLGISMTMALGHPAVVRAQCAMCGTAIQSGEDPLARGIFWSVLFLISLPYAIVGSFVVGLVWLYRRSQTKQTRTPLHVVSGRLDLASPRKEN